ncbi:MAG: ATP-binding protein [Sporomusaceae bacterium]|nr:ATP-binding protein [Sporomusaceae bacterium]
MFHRLRLKLTCINAFIIFSLFLLLMAGAYLFVQWDMERRTNEVASHMIHDIQSGVLMDDFSQRRPPEHFEGAPPPLAPLGPPPPGPPQGKNFFFAVEAAGGELLFQSSGALEQDKMLLLIGKIKQEAFVTGQCSLDQTMYSYWQASIPLYGASPEAKLFLFYDLSHDRHVLQMILITFLSVGAICTLLSFGASFFLANRAMVPIVKAWQQQRDFLSDASHELRTPLTVIQTNLAILARNQDCTIASQSKWFGHIRTECDAMAELVNGLLFLARADANQNILDCRSFDLQATVRRAVLPFETLAAEKEIVFSLQAEEEVSFYGDAGRLRQVITILLDNALRHTPPGGTIQVALQKQADQLRLTVKDTGTGIGEEHLTKIFDRFYQADPSRNAGGAGLGLAIAKMIVTSHGGKIWVDSELGQGTLFIIELPS